MNSLKSLCVVIVALMCSSYGLQSQTDVNQSDSEKIILYNKQAVKVELAGDKIKSFVGEAPEGYMDGYKIIPKAIVPAVQPIAAVSPQNVAVKSDSEVVNANYAIVTNEKVQLNYKPGYATLDRAMINELNEIVIKLKSNTKLKVLFTAHVLDVTSRAAQLADNRLGAATAYLKIKGIPLNRIKTERMIDAGLNDLVSVNFLK